MLKTEELEKQVKEITKEICMYYSDRYNKSNKIEKNNNLNPSFAELVRSIRKEYVSLTSINYYSSESTQFQGSLSISASNEDYLIRIYYDLQTGVISKMALEEVKSVYEKPIKYVQTAQIGDIVFYKEIPKSNNKRITKNIFSSYNHRIKDGEEITLESLLFELEELRIAMKEKSELQGVERGEIELDNLRNCIEYRKYKIMLIDGVYNIVARKLSKTLPVEYLEELRNDFNNTFGYNTEAINTVAGITKNKK